MSTSEIENPNVSNNEKEYFISFDNVKDAQSALKNHAHYTPLMTCKTLDKLCQRNLFFKCENFQKTGSFKFRGAFYAVHQLVREKDNLKPICVVTHSSGNHGQALAKAAQMFQVPAYIVMPIDSPQCKKDAVKGYGATVVECERSDRERKAAAAKVCLEKNGILVYINEQPTVMAGLGTMALEMLEQNPDLDIIVAPIGSGGMISGIAIAAKHIKPSIKVYAAEPELANDCYLSKLNGKIIPMPEPPKTVADGVKTAMCQNAWPIIRDLVDDVITVSEEEIKLAAKLIWERAKLVIEPTAGVGVAAVLSKKFATARNNSDNLKNVGVVLCGGNMDMSVTAKMLAETL